MMMLTLKDVLNTVDLEELEYKIYQAEEIEIKRLHKEHFNVYPRSVGMLGICTPFDYKLAYIKAIRRNIKYDEKKYLLSEGWTKEEIECTCWD